MLKYDYHKEKKIRQIEITNEIVDTLPDFTKEFFLQYCRIIRNMQERTITEYAKDLRVFFNYLLENNPSAGESLRDITLELIDRQSVKDLQEFISSISSYTDTDGTVHVNSPSGLNRKVASLRTFYRYFYTTGDLSSNPASILAAPNIPRKNIIRLERNESDDLLDAVEDPLNSLSNRRQAAWSDRTKYRDKAIIVLLLGTGIRISECVGLSLKDINWTNRAMRIVRKGGDEQIVYFNKDIEDALIDYIKYERKSPDDDVDALFVSRNRTRISVSAVERMVKKYAATAVPQKAITPHKLRATFATELNKANDGDLLQVSVALGHSSIETVKRYADEADLDRQKVPSLTNWTHKNSEIQKRD